MSIIITNVSEQYNKEYGVGEQHYILSINRNQLVEFKHNFEDGLSTCLRKAADAFEKMGEPLWETELKIKMLKILEEA